MITRRRSLPAALLGLALATSALTAGCSRESDVDRASDDPGDWTVLVYMDADNSLEPAAISDLAEMTEADGTQFIVLVDRAEDYADADLFGLGDFTDARLLRIRDGKVKLLDSPGELNMGDPTTLADFVETGLDDHRRDHNALVVWNHGGSWRGAAWDDSHDGDNLTPAEMAAGIKAGLSHTRVDRFDLLGFDACLMADVSVASDLAPVADYLVASEELEPGQGWNWAGVTDDGSSTATEFAQRIVDAYTEAADAAGIQDTTLSVVDLVRVEAVAEALDGPDGVAAVLDSPEAVEVVGRVAAARSDSLGFGRSAVPELDYWLVDLGNLAAGLAEVDGAEEAAAALAAAVDDAVVTGRYGPLAAEATGLAVYFPSSAAYRDVTYDGPGADMIDAFYARAAEVPESAVPLFVDEDRELTRRQVSADDDGIELRADVADRTGGNIASAELFGGSTDASGAIFYGRDRADVDGDTVTGRYDWKVLTLSDGRTTATAFADLDRTPDGAVARVDVPIRYSRGVVPLRGRLVLSVVDGQVSARTFFLNIVGGGVSAITPQAGDTFTPLLLKADLATRALSWLRAPGAGLSADPATLEATYSAAPSGQSALVGLSLVGVTNVADLVIHRTTTP